MNLKWEQRRPYEGKTSPVAAYFIGSERDADLEGFHGSDPIQLFRDQFPNTRRTDMIKDGGHMVQLEKSAEVNRLLLAYLGELRGG